MTEDPAQQRPWQARILGGLNWLLTANVFVVLAAFGWFAIALVGRSLNVALGFDLWLRLWEPVFTPAIGLLMAGAVV
ncbi:MAG: hypothetical protein AAGF24_14065, partial [Cyanobacteria bacterium P01_H01_bin.121]